jgi:hypothetical protein
MYGMTSQNCKIKKVYYTTKYNNKSIKITIYGNYRKHQINSGHGNGNV